MNTEFDSVSKIVKSRLNKLEADLVGIENSINECTAAKKSAVNATDEKAVKNHIKSLLKAISGGACKT